MRERVSIGWPSGEKIRQRYKSMPAMRFAARKGSITDATSSKLVSGTTRMSISSV